MGMSGGMSGTNGGQTGTSGVWPAWLPVAVVAAAGALIGIVNATSLMMESARNGVELDARVPWVQEVSSVLVIVALTPVIGWLMRRAPPVEGRWVRFAAVHLAGATAFSLAHVLGMVVLRKLAYAAAGEDYIFSSSGFPEGWVGPLLYEWRKDLLTYAAIALLHWIVDWRRAILAGQAAAPTSGLTGVRIEIRDGGRVFLLEPVEIAWVEAAGNYVEVHTGGAMHLARGTLAAFEERLAGHGFVRVHRSRLVNVARVTALSPTPSGDFLLTLNDGRTLAGSRRYRAGLDIGKA
jgi:hypothetical protein